MNYISDILYWISTGLMVPVILLLIFLFVRSLVLLGGFFGQYQSIRKREALLRPLLNKLTPLTVADLASRLPDDATGGTFTYIRDIFAANGSRARMSHILADAEMKADKDLSLSNTLAKMGPTLGLMGTLIPMGPALVGLATGDIASMAYNMQVAFATTVVGLFASAIGFVTKQVKQRWYLREITDLELIVDLLKEADGNETTTD